MKHLVLLLSIFFSVAGNAQEQKINFLLKAEIVKYKGKDKIFAIITRGNVKEIKKEVIRLGGQIGMSSGNIVQVRLLAHLIPSFSKNSFVHSIEYGGPNIKLLNDTTLINSNVLPIHNGTSPLLNSYTGKGVIFGLIDTGIDLDHDDFKDTLGNTRILKVWDQRNTDNGTSPFGYGSIMDSSAINNNTANHKDDFTFRGHGTHVAGIGTGNGLAVNNYKGVAPEASIVAVAVDLESTENTILDAVAYIYNVADSLGMPCVLNVSLGNYAGSHDGTDGIAVLIDSLINFKSGRAFVCAAGNAGSQPFHLQHQVNSDTTFTWFQYNPSSVLGYGAVFYEIWV